MIAVNKETLKKCISFTVIHWDEAYSIETRAGEYRNLMVLLREKICVEDFGECGGMGRCGTCIVEIMGLNDQSLIRERNEAATLGKMAMDRPNIRLACQILIDEDLQNATIRITS